MKQQGRIHRVKGTTGTSLQGDSIQHSYLGVDEGASNYDSI